MLLIPMKKPEPQTPPRTYVSHGRESDLNYFQIQQGSNIHSKALLLLYIPLFSYLRFFKNYSSFFEQKWSGNENAKTPKKNTRRWEAEELRSKKKSAGLQESEPEVTQRKQPREPSLCYYRPAWNTSMLWQKKIPCRSAAGHPAKSTPAKLKVQKNSSYRGNWRTEQLNTT